MIYISYDNQTYTEVYASYGETLDKLVEYFNNKYKVLTVNIIIDELMNISIKGIPVYSQVELFRDIYNALLEDCISMINENGDFI